MNLTAILAVWFLFIGVFAGKNYRISMLILSVQAAINLLLVNNKILEPLNYLEGKLFLINYDGFFALLLTFFFIKNPSIWRQCALLVFAAICHYKIAVSIILHESSFFFTNYEQLIIVIGILQMGASIDGFFSALRKISVFILRWNDDRVYNHSRNTTHQNSKGIP